MKAKRLADIGKMNDTQIRELVLNLINSHAGRGPINILKAEANAELMQYIMNKTEFLNTHETLFANMSTRIYMFAHGLDSADDLPKCKCCGKTICKNVISVHEGFRYESCSAKCNANRPEWKAACKNTKLERYGDENWNNRERAKLTCIERYGAETNMQTPEFKDMAKATKLELYGDKNFVNSEKTLKTKSEKYAPGELGNRISQGKARMLAEDPDYYKKQERLRKNTKLERHGDENWNNREQAGQTLDRKLEENPDFWHERNEKSRHTCIRKYGVDNYSKTGEYKRRVADTCSDRYGVGNYAQTEECKEKTAKTCLDRYGFESYAQTEEYRQGVSMRKNRESYMKISGGKTVRPEFSEDEYLAGRKREDLPWKCVKCGSTFTAPVNFPYGLKTGDYARCLKCDPVLHGKSHEERSMQEYILSIEPDAVCNDRSVINPFELDCNSRRLKTAFEFDGLFWHGSVWNSNARHLVDKTNMCSKVGIKLFHVFEDEWQTRRTQTENAIRRALTESTWLQPAYDIRHIGKNTASEFMEKNSQCIFAKTGNENLAVFESDEIVSVISYDIYNGRLIIHSHQDIMGQYFSNSFSLLLNELEQTENPEQVSFKMNMRWPFPEIMEKTGMKLVCITDPARWLMHNTRGRICRINNRAEAENALGVKLDENLTLTESIHEVGYSVIYDCGSMLFEKNRN